MNAPNILGCHGAESAGGVLVIEPDELRRENMQRRLARLDTGLRGVRSVREATAVLSQEGTPDVLVVNGGSAGSRGLCRWLRTTPRLSSMYVIVVEQSEAVAAARKSHWGADSWLECDGDLQLLVETTRVGLRAQAHYRAAKRRARRESLAWLATVVAHEINNPLASAMASLQFLGDELRQRSSGDGDAPELLSEMSGSLERIRSATARLQCDVIQPSPAAVTTDLEQLGRDISTSIDAPPARLEIDANQSLQRVFDVGLLLDAVRDIAKGVAQMGAASPEVLVTCDDHVVIVLLDFIGNLSGEPAVLLEPTLTASADCGGRYDPRLTWLESRFDRVGGQVFASRRRDRWRFGLMLPAPRQQAELSGRPERSSAAPTA